MNESTQQLRLKMDGRWSPSDLANLLTNTQDLYNLRLVLEVMREDASAFEHMYFELMHMPPSRRWRKRPPFGPPGFLFSGVGAGLTLPVDRDHLCRLAEFVYPGEALQLRRVSYASPGFTDLAGVGTIVGHVKDFTVRIIELWTQREQRRLANERSALENEALRIQNARDFVALAGELGYSQAEVRQLTAFTDQRQSILGALAERQKLIGAGVPETSDE